MIVELRPVQEVPSNSIVIQNRSNLITQLR